MVTEGSFSQSCDLSHDEQDSISTYSDSENDPNCDGAIVLHDGEDKQLPSFGNVSVMNSSDVHFGNKTFYQAPVTIQQFLYANGKTGYKTDSDSEIVLDATTLPNGHDSNVFIPDFPATKQEVNKSESRENRAEVIKGLRRLQKFSQENVVVLVSLLAVLLVSLMILMIVLLLRNNSVSNEENNNSSKINGDEQDKNTPIDSPIDPSGNLTLPGKLKLVSRLEWLAQPPVSPANPLPVPVPYVIISHTATENCSSQAQCVFHVRFIQTFHIESRGWWDIGYNFLVGGDGEAYEGRGWKSEGAHTYGYNDKSIGISFIGTFNSFKPPQRQITACKQLIAKGLELGYIKKDYKLLAARQLQATQSPGAVLYEDIKSWDHWATMP